MYFFASTFVIILVVGLLSKIVNGYIGVNVELSFGDAELYCQSNYGTSLATINNIDENIAVYEAAINGDIGPINFIWIGASDLEKEGAFIWNDGSGNLNSTYNNWDKNLDQPDGIGDCVVMTLLLSDNTYYWYDSPCTVTNEFVCNENSNDNTQTATSTTTPISTESSNYVGINIDMNFEDAETYCESNYGTSLATITNEEENMAVREAAINGGINKISFIWIGASDLETEGSFVWNDGSGNLDTIYNNWEPGQPNGIGNCVVMSTLTNYYWYDSSCDTLSPFVCNVNSVKNEYITKKQTMNMGSQEPTYTSIVTNGDDDNTGNNNNKNEGETTTSDDKSSKSDSKAGGTSTTNTTDNNNNGNNNNTHNIMSIIYLVLICVGCILLIFLLFVVIDYIKKKKQLKNNSNEDILNINNDQMISFDHYNRL